MTALSAIGGKWSPREAIRRRLLSWAQGKRGPMTPPFALVYRQIYVLPTAFGAAFALMLVFMALGGLNFNSNMALMLVFLLGVVAQMTTLLAYRNLVDLRVESIHAEPVFAGGKASFVIHVSDPEERDRFNLQAAPAHGPSSDCTDIAARSAATLEIRAPAKRRGWLDMPAFRLETRFPLGMFRAWTWIFPTARCLVYPAPAENPPPLPRIGEGQSGRAQRGEGEQIHGLRKYRIGDPLRRVAWRTSARHNKLYTREMETPRETACELKWNRLAGMGQEQRLAVLTAWVLLADHRQLTYTLELPGSPPIGPATGPGHRARCLEALALYGL